MQITNSEYGSPYLAVCHAMSLKRDVLERQSLSDVKMGRGSPISN